MRSRRKRRRRRKRIKGCWWRLNLGLFNVFVVLAIFTAAAAAAAAKRSSLLLLVLVIWFLLHELGLNLSRIFILIEVRHDGEDDADCHQQGGKEDVLSPLLRRRKAFVDKKAKCNAANELLMALTLNCQFSKAKCEF